MGSRGADFQAGRVGDWQAFRHSSAGSAMGRGRAEGHGARRPVSYQTLRVHVECHAGYRGEETPVRFRLGDRVLEVADVIDRWLAPDHRYFKVRVAGDIYSLRNDITSDRWD